MLFCDPALISAVTDSHLALGSVSYVGYCCSLSLEGKKKTARLGKQENAIASKKRQEYLPIF